ncbi:SH2B adapter protein 2 [Agrilus planipennis]|uniref:SH2B adapter protein 2 n=1 Tax=Agrilus planipennis TaxID=224129 RepID=A0A1W4WMF9_AGRPL|nr:SH2B adapter protein 2 [Agrilus planipennis]
MAGALDSVQNDGNWQEFCERHAKAAAHDFSKSCAHFISMNLPENARATVSHKDFLKKFVECFNEQFEVNFNKRKLQNSKVANGNTRPPDEGFTSETEDGSPKFHHKPFFRRLSFKMLKKGRDLFHKQHSDEVELAGSHSKTKLAKIVVECRKEGIVNYSTPESLDTPGGPPKWERCRLALVKAVGGYMLEFYSPPKSTKPRSGVFCALITEARETTALEMPDHENTFVLKAVNNMEFVIEAHDTDDMRSWLATIRYCMRSPGGSDNGGHFDHNSKNDYHSDAPELPPRHISGRPGDRLSNNSNFELSPSQSEIDAGVEHDIGQTLKKEFWFHGTLGRSEAAQLVLHEGATGHGLFLVRQSETRTGEFVLTFNFQGRAKHLRMTINEQGQCRVQHFWFQSIYEMLEHFRQQPIPLESGGNSDVTLTDYVVNPNARSQLSGSLTRSGQTGANNPNPSGNNNDRRVLPIPEVRQVQTHNGSVRTQETTWEQISSEAPSRAVENQYSFV